MISASANQRQSVTIAELQRCHHCNSTSCKFVELQWCKISDVFRCQMSADVFNVLMYSCNRARRLQGSMGVRGRYDLVRAWALNGVWECFIAYVGTKWGVGVQGGAGSR
jgi:hypothetical protein